MADLKAAASECWGQGCNIVPLKGKQPLHEWQKYETQRQSIEEFEALPWQEADGFAIVCGTKLENGLYFAALDFDVKNVSEEAKQKGKEILRHFLITQIEETPSGGQHWIFLSHTKPKTVSAFHNECGLELLGEGKLCIMAPSQGYQRLNDNMPSEVQNLNLEFQNALDKAGLKATVSKVSVPVTRKRRGKSKIRYCCEVALQRDRAIAHLMRLAIACEYKKLGWSDDDIVDLFRRQEDFDKDKCLVQVKSADPDRAASCESIREWGYCYYECPKREWTLDEAIDYELKMADRVELHPCMDYHPDTGLTVGAFLQTSGKILQIINQNVAQADFESLLIEERNPMTISVKQPSSMGMSRVQTKEMLLVAGELQNGIKTQNKAQKDVSDLLLQKALHYFFHSDHRWHLAISCFVIVTYHHRPFPILAHLVFQGPRGSGKTTIGLFLKSMCWNPTGLQAGLRSAPLFRSIEASRPTFFADLTKVDVRDIDLIDLFEVIEQDGSVRRCVGEENEPVDFYVFCPKVLMVRQSVPFSHKCIECITEPAPKGTPYTERRRFITVDSELADIRLNLLRSAVFNWRHVLVAYEGIEQDGGLYGRRFDLWRPLLAVCKIYYPESYHDLLNLAYEDAEKAEKGDVTSDVEDLLLAYFLGFKDDSQTFFLRDLTEYAQKQLGPKIVKSYHIVASALKNLGVVKNKTQTSDGVKYQVDLLKAHSLAKERKIEEPSVNSSTVTLDDLVSVYWADSVFGEHECGVCGYKRMTSWKGETNKGVKIPVCEDCQREFERKRGGEATS